MFFSKVIFWVVATAELAIILFFSVYQASADTRGLFFLITAIIVGCMLLFSVVSGALVLITINNIQTADPKLLYRTAVQLLVLSVVELLCMFCLGAVGAVTVSVATAAFSTVYGVTVVLAQLAQWVIMVALILQARLYTWQLKEMARPRVATLDSSKGKETRSSPNH